MPDPVRAAVRIESVRCVAFRGLAQAEIVLHPKLTILVGRNNAGKSRLLRAIAIAVGAVPADRDDLTFGQTGLATIDLVLAPASVDVEGNERFDESVTPAAGTAIQILAERPLRQRISWRTTIARSAEGFAAIATRTTRRFDVATGEWAATSAPMRREVLDLCRGHVIETGRDLAGEIRQRGSAANRLLSDLELEPNSVAGLQGDLDALSAAVVANSGTLQAVHAALAEVSARVDAVGAPRVLPVPGRVDELSSVASIELDDAEGVGLPLRLHGTGARSLASLRLQGVLYERRLGSDGGDLRPHAVTLVEEPEANLHPQAQFDLPQLLAAVPGQVVVSTHSTHLVSCVDQAHLRILSPSPTGLSVVTLEAVPDPDGTTPRQLRPQLYASEMEKLRRAVERPFGELLFASSVVLGDGATERALLPIVIRHGLGGLAHGLCVIDPESMNGPAAIAAVKAARLLGIPWFVLADGDDSGTSAVNDLLAALHLEAERESRVVQMDDDEATEAMFATFDGDLCRAAIAAVAAHQSNVGDDDLVRVMHDYKGSIGRFLGEELVARYPAADRWPEPLRALIEKMQAVLGAPTAGAAPAEAN